MSLNRREFVLSTTAAAFASVASPIFAAVEPTLEAAFDDIARQALAALPERLTGLGLDTGANSWACARLDDRSAAGRARALSSITRYRQILGRVNRSALSGHDQLLHDAVAYGLASGAIGAGFPFGRVNTFGGGYPYVISQQSGAYQSVPEFLGTMHRIAAHPDAEDYLSRLTAFATAIDDETEQARRDAEMGVTAPTFLLDTALAQMRALRAVPAGKARLVTSLSSRASERGIGGDWLARARKIVETIVYPALDRQIAAISALRAKATNEAGIGKLPRGELYYKWMLQFATSTDLSAAEIHAIGLEQGRELDARMEVVLRMQGLTYGTVGERLATLTKDPHQLFPNTEAGRAEAIAYVDRKLGELRELLPRISKMIMKVDLTVRRVPPDIESGAPLAYLNFASLDGSRPAIYYINLKDTSNWPRFTIPSLSAHEALPGHAWQGAYVAEHRSEVHVISSLIDCNAYTEGWALYAEQIVDELGLYENDPIGRLGMYQALRFRASRLVVDTGLHAMRWSRQQAIEYMTSSSGRARIACASEVDRYCASPALACGYKIGHTELLKLRKRAKYALGASYDVRDFNDAVIQAGAVPLTVLATAIDTYIASASDKARLQFGSDSKR